MFYFQAFAILSDKLAPLRDGVLANYKQWKRLSKEAEEAAKLNGAQMNTSDEGEATNNNNNNCSEKGAQSEECSNGTVINDIPKVVGKLGRIEQNMFIKTNGAITGTFGFDGGVGAGTGALSIKNCNENI